MVLSTSVRQLANREYSVHLFHPLQRLARLTLLVAHYMAAQIMTQKHSRMLRRTTL